MSASRPWGPYDDVSTWTSGSTAPDVPPRATCRSWCTGARPAPAAKTMRRVGCEARTLPGVPGPPGRLQLARRTRPRPATTPAAPPPRGRPRPARGARASACPPARRRRAPVRAAPSPTASARRWPGPARRRARRPASRPARRGRVRRDVPRPRRGNLTAGQPRPRARPPAGRPPTVRAATRSRAAPRADRQARPMPSRAFSCSRSRTSWWAGSTSYGASPWVNSVQPRRYGVRERARNRSTSCSGHRCWCRSIAATGHPGPIGSSGFADIGTPSGRHSRVSHSTLFSRATLRWVSPGNGPSG